MDALALNEWDSERTALSQVETPRSQFRRCDWTKLGVMKKAEAQKAMLARCDYYDLRKRSMVAGHRDTHFLD